MSYRIDREKKLSTMLKTILPSTAGSNKYINKRRVPHNVFGWDKYRTEHAPFLAAVVKPLRSPYVGASVLAKYRINGGDLVLWMKNRRYSVPDYPGFTATSDSGSRMNGQAMEINTTNDASRPTQPAVEPYCAACSRLRWK